MTFFKRSKEDTTGRKSWRKTAWTKLSLDGPIPDPEVAGGVQRQYLSGLFPASILRSFSRSSAHGQTLVKAGSSSFAGPSVRSHKSSLPHNYPPTPSISNTESSTSPTTVPRAQYQEQLSINGLASTHDADPWTQITASSDCFVDHGKDDHDSELLSGDLEADGELGPDERDSHRTSLSITTTGISAEHAPSASDGLGGNDADSQPSTLRPQEPPDTAGLPYMQGVATQIDGESTIVRTKKLTEDGTALEERVVLPRAGKYVAIVQMEIEGIEGSRGSRRVRNVSMPTQIMYGALWGFSAKWFDYIQR